MLRTKKVKLTLLQNSGFSNKFRNQLSSLTDSFVFFWNQICSKRAFLNQNRKSGYHFRIQHIRINIDAKLHLKQTIFNSWTKFAQKEYLPYNKGQKNFENKFSIPN